MSVDQSAMLRVENIHKNYGKEKVLEDISFEVKRGETKVIIGPSGTGKSTLLRCINQLTTPDSGRVWLDGVEVTNSGSDINQVRQSIGMVFQDFNLFSHLSALDNVRLGLLKVKKMDRREASQEAMRQLAGVGLGDKAASYPAELSLVASSSG